MIKYAVIFVLTALSSVGLAYLLNYVSERLIKPRKNSCSEIAVIPVDKECGDMELLFKYCTRFRTHENVIFLDCGMSEDQIAAARLFTSGKNGLFICNGDELYSLISALRSAFAGNDSIL